MYLSIFEGSVVALAAMAAAPWLRALGEALPKVILEEVDEDTAPEALRLAKEVKAARARRSIFHWSGGLAAGMALASFLCLPGTQALALCAFTACVLVLIVIDIRSMLLPDLLTLGLFWAGLLLNLGGMFVPLADAVLGGAVGYAVLAWPGVAFTLLRRQEGVAPGDPKMLSAVGAWVGLGMLLPIVVAACAVGVVQGGYLRWRGGSSGDPMPFGPAIGLAALGGMLLHLFT